MRRPTRRSNVSTRRIGWVQVGCLASALAIAAALPACGGASDTSTGPAVSDAAWAPAAGLPRKGLQDLTALRTRAGVFVVAGATHDATRLGLVRYAANGSVGRFTRSPLAWRTGYAAASTGRALLVWGGATAGGPAADGAIYAPSRGTWRRLPKAPLRARYLHSAVWTGAKLVVWGGAHEGVGGEHADGAAYNLQTGRWRAIARSPLSARYRHTAVWAGRLVLVWGGSDDSESERRGAPKTRFLSDGASYAPRTNRWRMLPAAPIRVTSRHTAVWTGREMVVWDGSMGAAYNPATRSWRALPPAPLEKREGHTAVWTGSAMIVWGGTRSGCGDCFLADGAVYDPAQDAWAPLPPAPLAGRDRHAAVWTGNGMLVTGGCCAGTAPFADAGLYASRT